MTSGSTSAGSFFRLGFGWPPPAELAEGLVRISRALDDATIG